MTIRNQRVKGKRKKVKVEYKRENFIFTPGVISNVLTFEEQHTYKYRQTSIFKLSLISL